MTGKTLAFLLPIGQRLVAEKGRVNALIVAPTRELASQIAAEAKSLFQFDETITIFSVHGGGSFGNDRRALRRRRPTILVATPGRLLDLLESKIALSPNILVLDEFDRLLEGSPELAKCLPFLPRASKRQTMMFSATLTQKTELYKAFFGSMEYGTIGGTDSEGNGSNLCQLEELTIRLPDMKAYLTFLVSILAQERERKVMVFLPTNKLVKFVNECFGANGWKQCWSIHSHMSNGSRERASQSFNESPNGILFSSDVSARGLDYPDVDMVLQYGLASSRALHLHRQGRTARAGKRGRSVVVRMPFEAKLSKDSRSYVVNEQTSIPTEFENRVRALVTSGHPVLGVSADSAAKSFAVYYLRHSNLSATSLTETTSMIARAFGLSESWELPDDFDMNPVVARRRKVRPS
jgi:ATP-dependent RNA helicase MSS116, mitochondrial